MSRSPRAAAAWWAGRDPCERRKARMTSEDRDDRRHRPERPSPTRGRTRPRPRATETDRLARAREPATTMATINSGQRRIAVLPMRTRPTAMTAIDGGAGSRKQRNNPRQRAEPHVRPRQRDGNGGGGRNETELLRRAGPATLRGGSQQPSPFPSSSVRESGWSGRRGPRTPPATATFCGGRSLLR